MNLPLFYLGGQMKAKIFSGRNDKEVEKKLNDFLFSSRAELKSSTQSDNGDTLTITIFYEDKVNG